ncbi:hypothetical protein ASZ90_017923 [hydrocarbon metagenome]|uniref:Uncharacterized protein n=1 Tax=hydrocarbon metagenome TaxID=938273 RepID=A0A0W8E854_9ZZZZ
MLVLFKANGLTALGKIKDLPSIFDDYPLDLTLKEYLRMRLN